MQPILRFIHSPKTGGASIQRSLESQPTFAKHKGHTPVHAMVGDLEGSVVFSNVRNPFTRAVSIYNFYRLKRDLVPRDTGFREFVSDHLMDLRSEVHTNQGCPAKPCSYFVSIDGKVVVQEILYFESLREDFRKLCRKFLFNAELQHLHRYDYYKKSNIESYYCPYTLDAVRSLYKADFENFGYSRDLENAYAPSLRKFVPSQTGRLTESR